LIGQKVIDLNVVAHGAGSFRVEWSIINKEEEKHVRKLKLKQIESAQNLNK